MPSPSICYCCGVLLSKPNPRQLCLMCARLSNNQRAKVLHEVRQKWLAVRNNAEFSRWIEGELLWEVNGDV